jgi:hypothetical protein
MGSVRKKSLVYLLLVLLTGCGGMTDDLLPSGSDKRSPVQCGVAGSDVCQIAPDFTLTDTLGNGVTLSAVLSSPSPSVQGVVMYFTMWCPICDSHMMHMVNYVIPGYPNVRFYAVDYVSGTIADARQAEVTNGYAGSGLTVLADTQQTVLGLYQATMGTTIVIDNTGVVRMNEDYKDGSRLLSTLAALP